MAGKQSRPNLKHPEILPSHSYTVSKHGGRSALTNKALGSNTCLEDLLSHYEVFCKLVQGQRE